MKKLLKWFAPGVAAALLMYAGQSAAVLVTPSTAVYTFNANCEDCAAATDAPNSPYLVTATLTLTGYAPGTLFGGTGSFLFQYFGSNLVNPFQLSSDSVSAELVRGDTFPSEIGALGVSLNFEIRGIAESFAGQLGQGGINLVGSSTFFESFSAGQWALGALVSIDVPCELEDCAPPPADFGNQHTYTLTSSTPAVNSNPVPEPGTLLLMGAALVAVGVARRRI